LIISGGIKTFLDGYYLVELSKMPAIYGQASSFLTFAKEGYSQLYKYVENQVNGLRMAKAYLRIKE
jgi:isopentenyl-diphosphate delta-isomerase